MTLSFGFFLQKFIRSLATSHSDYIAISLFHNKIYIYIFKEKKFILIKFTTFDWILNALFYYFSYFSKVLWFFLSAFTNLRGNQFLAQYS